jgi:hypothetical protein
LGGTASKLSLEYKRAKENGLTSVQGLYMQARDPAAIPGLYDLAEMLAMQHKAKGHLGTEDTP